MALTNAEKQKRWRDRRNALAKQALSQKPEPVTPEVVKIDPATFSTTKQQQLESAIRQHKHKLDLEFEQRILEECRKRIDEFILPEHSKQIDDLVAVAVGCGTLAIAALMAVTVVRAMRRGRP